MKPPLPNGRNLKPPTRDGMTFVGLAGMAGAFCMVVRATADPKQFIPSWEFHDGPTVQDTAQWSQQQLAKYRAEPDVVRVVVGPVSAEFRRDRPMVFVDKPVNRVNGTH